MTIWNLDDAVPNIKTTTNTNLQLGEERYSVGWTATSCTDARGRSLVFEIVNQPSTTTLITIYDTVWLLQGYIDTPDLRLIWIPLIQKREGRFVIPIRFLRQESATSLTNFSRGKPSVLSPGWPVSLTSRLPMVIIPTTSRPGVNRRRSNLLHYMGNLAARMLKRLEIKLGGNGIDSSRYIPTLAINAPPSHRRRQGIQQYARQRQPVAHGHPRSDDVVLSRIEYGVAGWVRRHGKVRAEPDVYKSHGLRPGYGIEDCVPLGTNQWLVVRRHAVAVLNNIISAKVLASRTRISPILSPTLMVHVVYHMSESQKLMFVTAVESYLATYKVAMKRIEEGPISPDAQKITYNLFNSPSPECSLEPDWRTCSPYFGAIFLSDIDSLRIQFGLMWNEKPNISDAACLISILPSEIGPNLGLKGTNEVSWAGQTVREKDILVADQANIEMNCEKG
ncbi:hypothetical protein CPC08DRAFT_756220 [Agrocybe pediades]|nr:hypothetical protein CPC08DRAFT_756220 [Agrocybe pediades]